MPQKIEWFGDILGVQPRIRMMRSYDERSHSYLGYVLSLRGTVGREEREFSVAIGPGAQAKHQFRTGDLVSGVGLPVADPELEIAELYKASGLTVNRRANSPDGLPASGPPWHGIPVTLEAYRERGHRRLDAATYDQKCRSCVWGCNMPVELVPDNWTGIVTKVRRETFCYGPKSCPLYRAGKKRQAPGRGGISYVEDDEVDEAETQHRGPDD